MREENWKHKGIETSTHEATRGESGFRNVITNLLHDLGRKSIHFLEQKKRKFQLNRWERGWGVLSFISLCQWWSDGSADMRRDYSVSHLISLERRKVISSGRHQVSRVCSLHGNMRNAMQCRSLSGYQKRFSLPTQQPLRFSLFLLPPTLEGLQPLSSLPCHSHSRYRLHHALKLL